MRSTTLLYQFQTMKQQNLLSSPLHNRGQALECVMSSKARYAFVLETISREPMISGTGDILVGFYSTEDIIVSVTFGPVSSEIFIPAHSFRFALDDTCEIPLISLAFHEVRVTSTGGPRLCVCILEYNRS